MVKSHPSTALKNPLRQWFFSHTTTEADKQRLRVPHVMSLQLDKADAVLPSWPLLGEGDTMHPDCAATIRYLSIYSISPVPNKTRSGQEHMGTWGALSKTYDRSFWSSPPPIKWEAVSETSELAMFSLMVHRSTAFEARWRKTHILWARSMWR